MTKQKILSLAADMLSDLGDILGDRMCNDWEFPDDWTEEERWEAVRAFHAYNGDPEEVASYDEPLMQDDTAAYLLYWLLREMVSEADDEDGKGV